MVTGHLRQRSRYGDCFARVRLPQQKLRFGDKSGNVGGDEGSLVFDIAILLYGNVETQVIENVDLTGAGQFDGNSVTFTVNVDNVTEFNSRYVAEFRIRSDDPEYADYSYLAAYADFSYNSSR